MEIHYLSVAGLLLIAFAWLLQYNSMKKRKQGIRKDFVAVNCVGIALLIVDGYFSGLYDIASANVLTFAGSLLVISRIRK